MKNSITLAASALALAMTLPLSAQEEAKAPAPPAEAVAPAAPVEAVAAPVEAAADKAAVAAPETVVEPAAMPAMPPPVDMAELEAKAGKLLDFLPETVATFGTDQKVTAQDVKKVLTPMLANALRGGQTPSESELKNGCHQFVRTMVDKQLILAQAKKDGITVSAEDVDKQLADMKKMFGKEQFEKMLTAQGLTLDKAKAQLQEDLAVKKWMDEKVKSQIVIDDAAVKKFYDDNPSYFSTPAQLSASHILIKVEKDADEKTKADAKAKAEGLLKKLQDGADFATLAKENSDCPSKEKGGDLGKFEPGMMVPAFSEAAQKLKKDELSGVVETQFGFHIIKGGEKSEASVKPLDEVKSDIKNYLQNQGSEGKMKEMLDTIRKEGNVKILLPEPVMPAMPKMEMAPADDNADKDAAVDDDSEEEDAKPAAAPAAAPAEPAEAK